MSVSFEIKQIIPPKQNHIIAKNPMYNEYIIPNHPARCLFTGCSGTGKSTLLLNLITNPMFLCGYFHNLIVFSPSIYTDPSWQTIIECPPAENFEGYETIDEEQIYEICKNMKEDVKFHGLDNSKRTLIIFDDCMGERQINSKEIMTLFTRGRHMNCSVWISGQSYSKIPRTIRLQCSNIFVFAPSTSELERLVDEYRQVGLSEQEMKLMIIDATMKPRGFVHINLQCPNRKDFLRDGLHRVFAF